MGPFSLPLPPRTTENAQDAFRTEEFLIVGMDVEVTFQSTTPGLPAKASAKAGDAIDGIADAECGMIRDGRWHLERKMSGDDVMLNYHLADAADNQSGSGLQFRSDGRRCSA